MPRLKVHSHARSKASADQTWSLVRDFCVPWHPLVETMAPERGPRGALIRSFTTKGDDTVYREQLTFFSESERVMAYSHLSGIQGVQSYSARLSVAALEGGASSITMSAELAAPALRAHEIAEGTQAIFDLGTQEIAQRAVGAALPEQDEARLEAVDIETVEIDSLPKLALSATQHDSDILCLFLHGIGGNRSNWSKQIAAMSPYCKVATLDLRGYGESTLGPEQSSVDDYCADILRVMEALGAKSLLLCGLSYGAWIATSFAMRHPELLSALVLSGGCTGMSEAGADERDAFRLSREVPMNEGQTPADFAPAVVNVIAGPNASDADREALLQSMAAIPTDTYADALRCFTNPLEKFDFARLEMPVLLMTGEHDKLAPPSEIKAIAERIWDNASKPDVRFEMIEGAGHVCNLEAPDQYNSILTEFAARVIR
ncbi:alpha/beta fold hydrolase [Planktotalea sp.]|uniref:alpha/beta fold hydrolase n=1 Tax=Planktotalea sp. TaxID=2029877 RepID=UPI003D6B1740